jgi:hypothetical protein
MKRQVNEHPIVLPRNNQRRLISTLYVIEKRLDELKSMLQYDGEGVMFDISDIPGVTEREAIHNSIEDLKKEIASLKLKYNLEARADSYSRTANSYISSGIIDLTEILSKGMKGYGRFLDEEEAEQYDRDIHHLRDILRKFPL